MVRLRFETTRLISLRYENFPVSIVRLIADVKFWKERKGFSKSFEAIVDTGAHTSIIPKNIWRDLKVKVIVKDTFIVGINRKEECQIPASLGKAAFLLVDEHGNRSKIFDTLTFLAKTDQVPLIVGFADILTEFKVAFDYSSGEAYIEEKSG